LPSGEELCAGAEDAGAWAGAEDCVVGMVGAVGAVTAGATGETVRLRVPACGAGVIRAGGVGMCGGGKAAFRSEAACTPAAALAGGVGGGASVSWPTNGRFWAIGPTTGIWPARLLTGRP